MTRKHRLSTMGRKFLILLVALTVVPACAVESQRTRSLESQVLALINGEPLSESEFEKFLMLRGYSHDLESDRSLKELFREFVTEQLLLREARRGEIELDERQVSDHVRQWSFEAGERRPELFEAVREFLIVQKFIRQQIESQITVSLQEMQNYYEQHSDEFVKQDQAHVLEILVAEEHEAQEIRSRLTFGDVRTFKNLARGHSQGLTAYEGGDLGIFEQGQLPKDFERVIFALKPGEISKPFRSGQGYHLFMMEEWIPRHAQKFHEVQDTIFKKLVSEKERVALKQYVGKLFEQTSIQILDEELRFEESEPNADIQ